MSHTILMLVVGFAVGCGVMACVWVSVSSRGKKAAAAQSAQREEILQYINGLLADTDAVEAAFRSGALSPESFKRQLGDRINMVMRSLRTNMHLLDVFYVKFVEQQAHEYLRILENPERRKTGLVRPDTPPAASIDLDGAADLGAAPPEPPVRRIEVLEGGFEPPEVEEPGGEFELPAPEGSAADERADETSGEGGVPAAPPLPERAEAREVQDAGAPEPEADAGPGAWDSMEEFEAAFEQFEVQAPPPAPEMPAPPPPKAPAPAPLPELSPPSAIETGVFTLTGLTESAEEPKFRQAPPPVADDDDEMVLEVSAPAPAARQRTPEEAMTETSSIDRSAITAALSAAAGRQTPLPPPPTRISVPEPQPAKVLMPVPPPQRISVPEQAGAPQQPAKPQAPPPQKAGADEEHQDMLNGDDVGDAIDAFFNLK